jgi:hypothetical protein
VTGNGRNRVQFRPAVSGLVVVRWSGGGTFPDLAASDAVSVSGKIVSRLRGGTGKSGHTHLVPASRDPVLVAALFPNHQGDCLRFHVQYFVRGRWKYDGIVKCVHLDKDSAAGVRLRGDRRLIGIPIRMRAEWRGDDFNAKSKGKWQYLRFVGGRSAASRSRLLQQPDRLRLHPVQARRLSELLGWVDEAGRCGHGRTQILGPRDSMGASRRTCHRVTPRVGVTAHQ